MYRLTGNIRYREQKKMFGSSLLVLQVEEERVNETDEQDLKNGAFPCNMPNIKYYRDANVKDLWELYSK